VRPQVEELEDHPDVGLHTPCRLARFPVRGGTRDGFSAHQDAPGGRLFEQGHAAQQSGLSRPRRSDDAKDLALLHTQRHRLQHFDLAEAFAQILRPDEELAVGWLATVGLHRVRFSRHGASQRSK
jgi:hypothetical protein